jgi:hypothetical protein
MAQGPGYTVKAIEPVAVGSDVQARLFTLASGEAIPWHFHSAVTDWYFVLAPHRSSRPTGYETVGGWDRLSHRRHKGRCFLGASQPVS